MNKLGLEYKRLILNIERDLLAQTRLRALLNVADDTIAGHRQDLCNTRARMKRVAPPKRRLAKQ